MNLLNLNIKKEEVDEVLRLKNTCDSDFSIKKDNHYQLIIEGGYINIYFKTTGKTSFLSQGKNKEEVDREIIILLESIKFYQESTKNVK